MLNVNWSNRSEYCSSLTSDDLGLPSSKSIFFVAFGSILYFCIAVCFYPFLILTYPYFYNKNL